jgi:hypothetical protein
LFKLSESLDSNFVHIQQNINEIAEEKRKKGEKSYWADPVPPAWGVRTISLIGRGHIRPRGVCGEFGATDQVSE